MSDNPQKPDTTGMPSLFFAKNGMPFLVTPEQKAEIAGDEHLQGRIEWLAGIIETLQKDTGHSFDPPVLLPESHLLDFSALTYFGEIIQIYEGIPKEITDQLWGEESAKREEIKSVLRMPFGALRKENNIGNTVIEYALAHELGHTVRAADILSLRRIDQEDLTRLATSYNAIKQHPAEAEQFTKKSGGNEAFLKHIDAIFTTLGKLHEATQAEDGSFSTERILQQIYDFTARENEWGAAVTKFLDAEKQSLSVAAARIDSSLNRRKKKDKSVPDTFRNILTDHENFLTAYNHAKEFWADDFSTRYNSTNASASHHLMIARGEKQLCHDSLTHPSDLRRLLRSELLADARERIKTPDGATDEAAATIYTNTAMHNVREASKVIEASKQRYTDRIHAEKAASKEDGPSR